MAVTETLELPSQPASGVTEYLPLGGDGFVAPFAAYLIRNMALTGDASGGNITWIVKMDPKYCALISYITLRNAQATPADMEYVLAIGGDRVPDFIDQGLIDTVAQTIDSTGASVTWRPPPYMMPFGKFAGASFSPNFNAKILNVDTDAAQVSALVYLFDARVRESCEMGMNLWQRGSM